MTRPTMIFCLIGLFLVSVARLQPPDVLPAPLYFLRSDTDELWRMEQDGITLTHIADDVDAGWNFDVSPADGSLVYVSNNDLIQADALGGDPIALVDGHDIVPSADENVVLVQRVMDQISQLQWSPDGSQIAFAQGGVRIISAEGGEAELLVANEIPDNDDSMMALLGSVSYTPEAWSPDGAHLVINILLPPESGGIEILDVESGAHVPITNPDDGSLACCYPSWSLDSASVYYSIANQFFTPGLWRADAETGESVTLIDGLDENGTYTLVGFPRQLSDDYLYSFMSVTEDPDLNHIMPLTMVRSAPDGVSNREALREDSHYLGEVLWAEDGSGAIIADLTDFEDTTKTDPPLLWLPADGSAAVSLDISGYNLRWGSDLDTQER